MTYLALEAARRRSPANWRWLPLRRVSTIRRAQNTERTERLLALSADRGVEPRPDDGGRQLASAATEQGYWVVHPNDLVFNPMWALEGSVAVSEVRGAVSTAYRVYEIAGDMHPRFLHHFMRSHVALEQYRALVRGVTTFDRSVTREDLDAMPVPAPSLEVQRTVSNFLDAETARIDALIIKKRRLRELVIERFRGLVSDAVAVGSSIEVRRVIELRTSGPRGWANRVGDSGAPFIRSQNLRRDGIELDLSTAARVHPAESPEAHRSRTREGDVLIGITGANTGWVGLVREQSAEGYVSQHVAVLRPHQVVPEWLAYSLFAHQAQDQLLGGQYGGTKTQLALDDLATLRICVPSESEQREGVERIKRALTQIRWVEQALSRQIGLLLQHRQALVTAAVTGELEIPRMSA